MSRIKQNQERMNALKLKKLAASWILVSLRVHMGRKRELVLRYRLLMMMTVMMSRLILLCMRYYM
jgi:hypothetical protein